MFVLILMFRVQDICRYYTLIPDNTTCDHFLLVNYVKKMTCVKHCTPVFCVYRGMFVLLFVDGI